ncbi:hypothetical protein CDAR_373521 [Caerostris darwini]|uniref:Secreted protein n=1 Tax=Caerostris darwini TaxID=1538125 RepID=A0AAV4QKX4_9ARAC|nr:hypothetical protein CDAR_373521 [Caerostris darwini]
MFQHCFLFFFFFDLLELPFRGTAPITPGKCTTIRGEVDIRSGCFSSQEHAGRGGLFNLYEGNCHRKCCSSHGQSTVSFTNFCPVPRHQCACMQTSKEDS